MKKFKRAVAALAASAMMFSLSGCTDTRYAMTYDNGTKVNAGVYIYNLYTELSYQMTMSYYSSGGEDFDLDSDMDGQKLRDYLVDQARKATKEFAAVTYQFDKLGLTLTEEELERISDSVKSVWDTSGDLLEAEGISKESVRQVFKAETMRSRLFDYYYGEGGTEAASDEELQKYVEDNFIRYKAIRISKSYAEDETEAAEENAESEALRDEYLAKAEGLSYDEFDAVIDEYNAYAEAKYEAALEAEEEENSEDIVGPVAGDDSTEVDAPVDDDEAYTDGEPNEGIEPRTIEIDDEALTDGEPNEGIEPRTIELDDEALTDGEPNEGIEPRVIDDEDPNAGIELYSDDGLTTDDEDGSSNESVINYGGMDDEAKESVTGKLAAFLNGMEVGKATAYDDDSFYYILIKGDIAEYSPKYVEDNHDSLVQQLKGDDFQAKIDSWVEEIGITENTDAIKRYTAQVVYDKQMEFYGA